MKRKCIILVRGVGFPYGLSAAREKTLLMGKLYAAIGYDVHILSNRYFEKPDDGADVQTRGTYEGLHYYIPALASRSDSKFKKAGLYLLTLFRIARYIIFIRRQYANATLLFSRTLTPNIVLYTIIGRLWRIPLIFHIEEWPLAFADRRMGKWWRYNERFSAQMPPRFSHGAICISEYLRRKIVHVNPNLPIFQLPVLADFSIIEQTPLFESGTLPSRATFAYCASTAYMEVTQMILDAFIQLLRNSEGQARLVLILHGNQEEIRRLQCEYSEYNDAIVFLSGLAYAELIGRLKSADALLIPLRPTDQDAARFPHKIAEYTATGRPIVTNWHGEIRHYFEDRKNVLIMKEYSPDALVEQMLFVLDNPAEAARIGQAGYEVGKQNFDFPVYIKPLKEFMEVFDGRQK